MDALDELQKAKRDCLRWLKSLHNFHRAGHFVDRFCHIQDSDDHIKEALFQVAVVSYAKPFTSAETSTGMTSQPIKPYRQMLGFDYSIHKHLMQLRHKLIAHDDYTEIEPKLTWVSISGALNSNNALIPIQANLRNSCISYPQDIDHSNQILTHIKASCEGTLQLLAAQVVETRRLILANPKEAGIIFVERPDSQIAVISGDGETSKFTLDLSAVDTHPALDVTTRYQSPNSGNYRHTTINVRINFSGKYEISDGNNKPGASWCWSMHSGSFISPLNCDNTEKRGRQPKTT